MLLDGPGVLNIWLWIPLSVAIFILGVWCRCSESLLSYSLVDGDRFNDR
jgi:hypothetical protein